MLLLGGFHLEKSLVLIMDVARFKYPPYWVSLQALWDSMQWQDKFSGMSRGYFKISTSSSSSSSWNININNVKHNSAVSSVQSMTTALSSSSCVCSSCFSSSSSSNDNNINNSSNSSSFNVTMPSNNNNNNSWQPSSTAKTHNSYDELKVKNGVSSSGRSSSSSSRSVLSDTDSDANIICIANTAGQCNQINQNSNSSSNSNQQQ